MQWQDASCPSTSLCPESDHPALARACTDEMTPTDASHPQQSNKVKGEEPLWGLGLDLAFETQLQDCVTGLWGGS